MKSRLIVFGLFLFFTFKAEAATFGDQLIVTPVKVARIYQGWSSGVYVTFTGAPLLGCAGSSGGYLRPSWSAANGSVDNATTDRMLSVLLFAKSVDQNVEVRYRVNSDGTGWDKCSIEGIYLH